MPVAVTFLSDYGLRDEFVGVCHGVIAGIAPDARVIDVTHGIGRHDVRAGALALRRALPHMPPGVHLAVVDPEVGSSRRAVALRCAEDDRVLVGPDNGLLMPAAEHFGGVVEAVDISASPLRLGHVSATFHGRDVFAPVAAHLAAGTPLSTAGTPLEVAELAELALPRPELRDGAVLAHVLSVDGFGNLGLDAAHPDLSSTGLRLGRPLLANGRPATFAGTFADVPAGALVLYEDPDRMLALAVNRGSAAADLDVGPDAEILLAPAG